MPNERPTLPELIDQGATEIESRVPGVLARVRNSVIGSLNRVWQGGLSALYKHVDYLAQQWWPDTCAPEFLPLHGARWGKPRLTSAPATGTHQFVGLEGAEVPEGTTVKRSDGVQFTTTEPGVIAAGVAEVPIEALLPGQLGNSAIGTELTLTSPVPNINATGVTVTALGGGADVETIERWRARILLRIRKPPQGGADYDYEGWALEVPGVTRAWVYPGEAGAGTVVVRFVRDDDEDLIPSAGEVETVQAYIDARRPVTAATTVLAPIATPQAYTIHLDPDTPAIRAAVLAELAELYRREAKPGGTMLISHQREAISISPGENDHVLTVPSANQVYTAGLLPTVGAVTWA